MHHVGWPWSWTGALQGGVAPTPSQVYGKAGKPTPWKSHLLDSDPMEEQRVQRWTNTSRSQLLLLLRHSRLLHHA